MTSLFKPEFFKANRRRLREQSGCQLIVVPANGLLQRGADSTYSFAQEANFWYLTGVELPDLILIIDGNEEYIIVPGRSESRQAFDGHVSHDEVIKRSGIPTVYEGDEGWALLTGRIKKSNKVGLLPDPPAYIEQLGFYTNPARSAVNQKVKAINQAAEVVDIGVNLRAMRMIKQSEEVQAIQKAIDITAETIKAVTAPEQMSNYKFEYEIEADLGAGFRKRGAAGHGFEPIVAAGANGCTLHYVENSGKLGGNDLIVIDVGAQYEQYSADITRTIARGVVSRRQREVYDAVLDVQAHATSLLKPGVTLREYENQVRGYMGQKLQQLKLVNSNDPAEMRHYYPHATTHFLGLNVHDVGDYEQPLQPGMVMTVEPGIYIPEEAIGVRIEDDILITEEGIKVLSDKLARELT
jgi:Xaa-Pro aminopeptidase